MQELYDKLKRKAMLGHIQEAASDAVDTTLNSGAGMGAHILDRSDRSTNYEQQFETSYGAPRYANIIDPPAYPTMGPPQTQNATWARPAPPRGTLVCRWSRLE